MYYTTKKKPFFFRISIVDILENMGIEIEKPVYSPYDIIEEDIISIEKSREA